MEKELEAEEPSTVVEQIEIPNENVSRSNEMSTSAETKEIERLGVINNCPFDIILQFIKAIMQKKYVDALKKAKQIAAAYEPENEIVREYIPVLEEIIEVENEKGNSEEQEEEDDEESSQDHDEEDEEQTEESDGGVSSSTDTEESTNSEISSSTDSATESVTDTENCTSTSENEENSSEPQSNITTDEDVSNNEGTNSETSTDAGYES